MTHVIYVALAGAAGALCRWGIGKAAVRLFGPAFPWGTFIVNLAGCFLIGLIMHIGLNSDKIPSSLRTALTVGFLGALTTFSSFSYETLILLEQARWMAASVNIIVNLVLGLAATIGGLALGRILLGGHIG